MQKKRLVIAATTILALVAGVIIGLQGRAPDSSVTIHVASTRPTPVPMIFEMHDWANQDWPDEWGEIGSWMYWGLDEIEASRVYSPALGIDTFAVIDNYLARAAVLGKPVALSIMLINDVGKDSTPKSLYQQMGRTGGWDLPCASGCVQYTGPMWNDSTWDNYYKRTVLALGARYNGDPRLHSVWFAPGLYGEAIFSKTLENGCKWDANGHNPTRFVQNAVNWYAEAFPNKPVFLIGSVTRRDLAEYAASKGVGVKLHSLAGDVLTHVRPRDGSGSATIMQAVNGLVPVGFEHAFANSSAQAYYAMLTGLALGMDVLDLPDSYLTTLASTRIPTGESLLSFTRRMMQPVNSTGAVLPFWVARDTIHSCPAGAYDCGYSGPWARDMTVSGALTAGASLRIYSPKTLPTDAPAQLVGLQMGGARIAGMVEVVCDAPAGMRLVAYLADGAGWQRQELAEAGPGTWTLTTTGWLHLILAEEADPPTPTPTQTATVQATVPATPTDTPQPTATATPDWSLDREAFDKRLTEIERILGAMRDALK